MKLTLVILAVLLGLVLAAARAGPIDTWPGTVVDCRQTPAACQIEAEATLEHYLFFLDSTHRVTLHINGQGEIRLFDVTFFQTDANQSGCLPGVVVQADTNRGWVVGDNVRFSGRLNGLCSRLTTTGVAYEGLHLSDGICEDVSVGVPCLDINNGRIILADMVFNTSGCAFRFTGSQLVDRSIVLRSGACSGWW